MEIFNEKLEALLMCKPFDDLTSEETSYVLQHISKEAYNSYFNLLGNTSIQIATENLEPDSAILENLKQRFKDKHQEKPTVNSLIKISSHYSKLLLRVACLFMILLCISIYLYVYQNQKSETLGLKSKEVKLPKLTNNKVFSSDEEVISNSESSFKKVKMVDDFVDIKAQSKNSTDTLVINHDLLEPKLLGLETKIEPIALNLEIEDDDVPLALDIKVEKEVNIYEELLKIKL